MPSILRRIMLGLWQLLPANPILVRVVHGASRRPRHLLLRAMYIGALLTVILASLVPSLSGASSSLTNLAKAASQTFTTASLVQLAMMCLMAPMFTAAAITQERDAQTFNILLSTPLTNAQIVFGSLLSRLYFVIMLLFAGLPIFLMTMVYGGVTQSQVFESFALSGATAILTGALAIAIAMAGVGTRRTIFSFYLSIALYLVAGILLARWSATWLPAAPANIDGQKMSWLAPLHPFLALDVALNRIEAPPAGRLGGYPSLLRFAFSRPAAAYVTWTSLTALLLTISSIVLVRRGAKTGEMTIGLRLKMLLTLGRAGSRTRPPRAVWDNPVAWREARTRGQSGGLLRWTIILAGIVVSALLLLYYLSGDWTAGEVSQWLAGLVIIQFAMALLIATNTAATSITKERESKTMDILLTTPVTSKYILWGKLRGLVSFAMPLLAGPIIALLVFGVIDAVRRPEVPVVWLETGILVGLMMVIYTAVACVIGLYISLISRKNVTAVLYSIGALILLCGLSSGIGFALADNVAGRGGAFLAPLSPFSAVFYLVHPESLFESTAEFARMAAGARSASLIGVGIGLIIFGMVVWTVYTGLVRNFDMIVRKQSGT